MTDQELDDLIKRILVDAMKMDLEVDDKKIIICFLSCNWTVRT